MEKQEKKQDERKAVLDRNMRFYQQGAEVPADALKRINAGRLKGMSDVNPMWRMRRLTEIFGPVGFGWRYVIDRQWTETYGQEVKCFCNVTLYVRDPESGAWSEGIPGCGGSAIVSVERSGAYVNDEGYKMALTDALSIAMKPLGIGANVWYGPKASGHNESKYEAYTQQQQPDPGELLRQASAELAACASRDDVSRFWAKWAAQSPDLCATGAPIYNAVREHQAKLAS